MASRSFQRKPVPRSIPEQTQAAAAARTNAEAPLRRDPALQTTDLTTPEPAEDEAPPPAYGDVYGELRNEKNGASATVTDDGRVDIRVNALSRRLSQIFVPIPEPQAKESRPSTAPYVPSTLGGEHRGLPPPPLNVVIQIVGSRGDVQPFVALGKVLRDSYGHRVRLATHPNFKDFVLENGLEFFSIGGDPSKLMAFMVKNPGLMPSIRTMMSGDIGQRRKEVGEYIEGCWRSCYQPGDGMDSDDEVSGPAAQPFVADCIIANPPSFAHIHCAEKLGIPLHIMFTMPYSPTRAFPHPLANIQSSNADPQLTNYISYALIETLTWQGLGDVINNLRTRSLGLDPVSLLRAPGMLQRLQVPHTYCWSPALIPKPSDWARHISIAGFCFLETASYAPSPDLRAFLESGPPPVYLGFGSIVLDDPNAMTELIFEAVRITGQRLLLSKGWGGMGGDELQDRSPDGVFMLGNVPHDWLFKQVSCVVHHGGAGTTAAGIAAGRPTLVIPFFGDQPFWGAMIARAGAGPDPIPHKQLTAEKLADAIYFCLRPESLERAGALAGKMAAERGNETGAQAFHEHLKVDRLRCTLAPSRSAAWRIKRTQIRLSAFAACTLANADLLDFHDLKLFRAQEYRTDEGPADPVSGSFFTVGGSFGNMAMGLAEMPGQTMKALRKIPSSSSGQQPQPSGSGIARKPISEISSPAQSQTSLNTQEASRSQYRNQEVIISRKSQPKPRPKGRHTTKGLGRFMKAATSAPMDFTYDLTNNFHNAPKLWGDDTVRPQQQVTDAKSGFKAAGKEFSFGLYDGVTGLFTQPWKGARKQGAVGFAKGFGKGVGGFATKPSAAVASVLGYSMKGMHKEMQKLFGGNELQNYIVASRTAQGYKEWQQSSEAERQDVVDLWGLIQKYMKEGPGSDEMVWDVLEAQRKSKLQEQARERGESPPQSAAADANVSAQGLDSVTPAADGSRASSLVSAGTDYAESLRPHSGADAITDLTVPAAGSSSGIHRAPQDGGFLAGTSQSELERRHWRWS